MVVLGALASRNASANHGSLNFRRSRPFLLSGFCYRRELYARVSHTLNATGRATRRSLAVLITAFLGCSAPEPTFETTTSQLDAASASPETTTVRVTSENEDGTGTDAIPECSAPSLTSAGSTPATACERKKLHFGVNVHDGGATPELLANVVSERGLTRARFDLWGTDEVYVAQFRKAVTALAAKGISSEAILFDVFSRGQLAWEMCDADLELVERIAYEQTLTSLVRTDDLVTDYELQNEMSLYPNIKKSGTTGQIASDYDIPCGRMQAANLRGMSRAFAAERQRTGRRLRIVLGTTDRSYGLLAFMGQQGVPFDVVGYHIYPAEWHQPLDQDPWFGPGGPLTQLAAFHRPIHINELHCAEIYDPSYENQAGQPKTEACWRSVAKHVRAIASQTVADVEAVDFYEMSDETNKPAPENRFGLAYDLATPKVALYLASAFAGGHLDSAEALELTSRDLVGASEIAAWSACGAGP